ncbi:DUF2975 domain-containing protein [Phnomibacter ginsenosidimutans]|uniref:DUF2975 domain-containing protein n=1 Tax=Phnomibacter ginsenosidimutans TaxID=2676868 RepID=A0A6I6H3Z3_9BACT|nr:DUF2975 domain-containing protein [Phnomibacter ginsenosidimutans]QGW29171.1 DUF2975 domain-containing protein [Phnomibacter ginsenosidimutans]
MQIVITTRHILKALYVLAWIIFIGLCYEAGVWVFNPVVTMYYSESNVMYPGIHQLYHFDKGHYFTEIILIVIPAVLKAILFYMIVKLLHDEKLNMNQPFNAATGRFLLTAAYISLGIGIFALWAVKHTLWLETLGAKLPSIQTLSIAGGDVWLFMAVILFIVAQIFKRGIELQAENDLTI